MCIFIATSKNIRHYGMWKFVPFASVKVGVLDPAAVWSWGTSGVLFKIWVADGCFWFDARAPVFLCARFVQFSWHSRPRPVHSTAFRCAPHSGALVLVPLYVARWVSSNCNISTLDIQPSPSVWAMTIFKLHFKQPLICPFSIDACGLYFV